MRRRSTKCSLIASIAPADRIPCSSSRTRHRNSSRSAVGTSAGQALRRFYEEIDERFGTGPVRPSERSLSSALLGKLRDEFKHDRVELERKLESWIRAIVEEPGSRLSTANDRLDKLCKELNKQIDSAAARMHKFQVQRSELRDRRSVLSGTARTSIPHLLRPLHRESTPQAEELCRYGRLWVQETAALIRSEILAGLLAKARQIEETLGLLHRSIEGIGRPFLVKCPPFRNSEHALLGRSVELFPGDALGMDELRTKLTDSFCSERTAGRHRVETPGGSFRGTWRAGGGDGT